MILHNAIELIIISNKAPIPAPIPTTICIAVSDMNDSHNDIAMGSYNALS